MSKYDIKTLVAERDEALTKYTELKEKYDRDIPHGQLRLGFYDPNLTVSDAMNVITKALKEDDEYKNGWQANVAMAFIDETERHLGERIELTYQEVANNAADNFLTLLCKDM